MKTKRKKLGFALGSGGSRGVAHAGFLKAMEENGIKPDYISGCSMGAVVGRRMPQGLRRTRLWRRSKRSVFAILCT